MTLREFYQAIGSDAGEVVKRLGSEEMVVRFVRRFADDGEFAALCSALRARDATAAFRSAHTLKGICANLGFSRLYDAASALTERLRGGSLEGTQALLTAAEQAYHGVIDAIRALE